MMDTRKLIIVSVLLVLASCSSGKKGLNLTKRAPDEFRVISNPPLHIPPNFDLNNPNKPAETVHEADVKELTVAERSFLKSLGGLPNAVDHDVNIEENKDKGAIRNFFSKMKGKSSDAVVDHVKEKDRIEKNKIEGNPINVGEVPTRKKGSSTIDKLLGNAE